MAKEGKNSVTADTPKKILFGAGTIHKNLKYSAGAWNFAASMVGATSGGSKLSIVPEVTKVEVDGTMVAVKGLSIKTGETATLEVNLIELSKEVMTAALLGANGTSDDTTFDLIESKANILSGDYWDNIAFVGKNLGGANIIAILDNALCTSGLELEGKNKEGTVGTVTFECHADIENDDDLDKLPWHIYYPNDTEPSPVEPSTDDTEPSVEP